MNRYFIAVLLKGEAQAYQEQMVQDIASKFSVQYLVEHKVPAHITLKAPFETNDISEVSTILKTYAESVSVGEVQLEGFSHFGENVIYIDVEPSQLLSTVRSELLQKLIQLPWMTQKEHEHSDESFTPHVTVAYRDLKPYFDAVWQYVQSVDPQPRFMIPVDHVALLRKEGKDWVVYEEFPFTSPMH